mgnify:FL=1|nr:MAG TPA: hypothetical protein [Caudoviricetes sp.]
MELQKLTIGDNKLYLDGVEIKNVKEFTLKSSAMSEAELNLTVYVTVGQDPCEQEMK